jgi:hypothetical protein
MDVYLQAILSSWLDECESDRFIPEDMISADL